MKKKIAALALTLVLTLPILTTSTLAYTNVQQNTADALNYLGLFLGTGEADHYALDRAPLMRSEGITLLVRLIGKEAEAQSGKYSHPFSDVPDWLDGYVAYAYEKGITNGGDGGKFQTEMAMTDYMYLTLILRALGYSDAGEDAEYTWQTPYALAKKLGLISYSSQDTVFSRGDAVEVFWNALNTKLNGQDKTLAESLIGQKVFSADAWAEAVDIRENGRKENPETPVDPGNSGNSGNSGDSGNTGSGDETSDEGSGSETYTWEEYQALTAEQQWEFYKSFADPADFVAWQEAAKAAYDAEHPVIEIGPGGSIDLGDLIES